MKVDIALADGNTLMLSALSELFEKDDRFSLVSATNTAESFLQATLTVPSSVAVIDWSLPDLGAERLLQVLREQQTPTRIIVSTHGTSNDLPKRAMAAGAAGFCSHKEPPERLVETAWEVSTGKMVFPYLDVRDLQDPLQSLTKTEKALLMSLSLGRTNKQLSSDHRISINTVKFHLRNMYDKLAVNSRAQAIAFYYSNSPNQSSRDVDQG